MAHFIILFLCWLPGLLKAQAQQPPCPEYPDLIDAGEKFIKAKKYQEALNKFNAAKLCLPDSSHSVDQRIQNVFTAIEGEKNEALRQKNLADKATKRSDSLRMEALLQKKKAEILKDSADYNRKNAEKQSREAQRQKEQALALYWASESDKLDDVQAIRLLEKAAYLEFGLNIVPVYERLFRRFNESNAVATPLALLHKDLVKSAFFVGDENHILTTSLNDTAQLWTSQGKLLISLPHQGPVFSGSSLKDGSRLLTASFDSTARLWDVNGNRLASLQHNGPVRSAVFSHDGRRLLTASADSTARLWDDTGKPLATLKHNGPVYSATFSKNDNRILTASADQTAKLWDSEGSLLATLPHRGLVRMAVFSEHGDSLLTASYDGTAKLWDKLGKPLHTLHHDKPVYFATFSANGRHILTTSYDNTAKLWTMAGDCIASFPHKNLVYSAVLSQDGRHVLTASADSTAQLWAFEGNSLMTKETKETSGAKGTPIAIMRHGGAVYTAIFSADECTIWTVSEDQTVKRWFTAEGVLNWLIQDNTKVHSLSSDNRSKYDIPPDKPSNK